MTIPEVEIDFVSSPGEPSGEGVSEVFRDYRQEIYALKDVAIKELDQEMRRRRTEIEQHFRMLDSLPHQPARDRLVGVPIDLPVRAFFHDVQIVLPSLGTLLGVWLQARFGRKVRIKVGDIEVEARTAEEVDALLKQALEVKKANEPKLIHEP
jgi:hypothetical protein